MTEPVIGSHSTMKEEDMPEQTYKQRLAQYGDKLTTQQSLSTSLRHLFRPFRGLSRKLSRVSR